MPGIWPVVGDRLALLPQAPLVVSGAVESLEENPRSSGLCTQVHSRRERV